MKLATIQFLFTLNRGIIYMFGISLAVNLYKQAISFEKGHVIVDPQRLENEYKIDEIQRVIDEIKELSNNSGSITDYSFKNQKIIAWLLNRNKEVQSGERQMFFTNLNLELQQEQLLEDGSMSPHLFNSGIGDRGEDKYGDTETIG